MIRARFVSTADDPRPVEWPIQHPYWITGENDEGLTIVAYADDEAEIRRLWPEADEIDVLDEPDQYTFTDRFPRPEWMEP